MRFVTESDVAARIKHRTVAIVGSAPSVLNNQPCFVDSHQVVIRVNNYKLSEQAGHRADIHYSFYGTSITKSVSELKRDGVTLCMCKCPNTKPITSAWHEQNGKLTGIDFRYIYDLRSLWWWCDTYIPTDESFLHTFRLLNNHIPTTGFAAILEVLRWEPKSVYLTGFDFFRSGMHNVDERWRPGNPSDPIGHRPELESEWLFKNMRYFPITLDAGLNRIMRQTKVAS